MRDAPRHALSILGDGSQYRNARKFRIPYLRSQMGALKKCQQASALKSRPGANVSRTLLTERGAYGILDSLDLVVIFPAWLQV